MVKTDFTNKKDMPHGAVEAVPDNLLASEVEESRKKYEDAFAREKQRIKDKKIQES